MTLFLKRCTLTALFSLTLTTTVQAAESGNSPAFKTYQGETNSTQLAEYTESAEPSLTQSPIVPQKRLSTLSGESLDRIENRNLAKDFTSLFSTTSVVSESMPIFLPRMTTMPTIQIPTILEELSKKIEVDAGDSSLDSDQILKVRYHLNWTN